MFRGHFGDISVTFQLRLGDFGVVSVFVGFRCVFENKNICPNISSSTCSVLTIFVF